MSNQSDLTGRYTKQAEVYRALWAPVLRPLGLRLLQNLAPGLVRCALDVGTGVGSLLEDLQKTFPGATVLGVDRAAGMLAQAPPESSVAIMDAAQLGIASDSLDVVIFPFMLFHLPEPRDGLVEGHRALRSGGALGTVTWAGDFESHADRVWAGELDAYQATPIDELPHLAQHELVDTPQKMQGLLESAGFNEIRAWEEPYTFAFPLNHFTGLKTGFGRQSRRLESLDPSVQPRFLESALAKVSRLGPEDFVSQGRIVFSTARKN